MKILAIGPYLGSFKEEIYTFRPYAKWLTKAIKHSKVYLSTHLNRAFLYDFIPEENIIPVYQNFTRDEENQEGYIHRNLQKKDYKIIARRFKDEIIKLEKCSKKDIELRSVAYSKTTPSYSIYKKIFNSIPRTKIEIPEDNENKLIFIPAKEESLEKISYVYKNLKIWYNDIIVVGDIHTWFSDDNVVLNQIDYFENGFKYIIEYIAHARAIITPLGSWTGIANLQNKPVFSWGSPPGPYREDGDYNFGNRKCSVMYADKDTHPDIILSGINDFLRR